MRATRAIVLARGLGTRMREPDPGAPLSEAQRRAADTGRKAMIPLNGRPFLDYALSALADAGIAEVALVVAPDHDDIRRHYAANIPTRVTLTYVVQQEPRGTANAVMAADAWTRGRPFLTMNADNLYPVPALRALASLDEPGLAVFDREDLVESSNIPPDRVLAFALVDVDGHGYLTRIVEKPADPPLQEVSVASADRNPGGRAAAADTLVSMNCWRFDARIFESCRDVPRSPRGEFELPEAVALANARGVRFKAVPARGPVLDLSRRADTAVLERRLSGTDARP